MKKTMLVFGIVITSVITTFVVFVGSLFLLLAAEEYKGVVVAEKPTDDGWVYTIKEEVSGEYMAILANIHTTVYYCHHERDIYSGDIEIGQVVKVTCRKYFRKNNYAPSIEVQYRHENNHALP